LVFADEKQWQRAFTNLIQNAVQAIPDEQKGEIKVKIKLKDEHVLIQIKDNGMGMDDDVKEKIFTPNFTTKTGGMGLGLAMLKKIVETYEGDITFNSSKGKGTTFKVRIPTE